MKKTFGLITLAILTLLAFSCSTTVSTDVTRPAELDLEGVNTVSLLPFKTSSEMDLNSNGTKPVYSFYDYFDKYQTQYSKMNDEFDIVNAIDSKLYTKMSMESDLTLVDPAAVERAFRSKSTLPVDIYVTGGITSFSSIIESEVVERTTKQGKVPAEKYWRELNLSLLYQVVDTNTNTVLSHNEFDYSAKSSKEYALDDVATTYSLAESKVNAFVAEIMKEFLPYEEEKSLTLLSHKDSAMKEAEKLAKKGQLGMAKNKYLSLYNSKDYFEAGYNAALLLQAMEEYEDAKEVMTKVYKRFGDQRAKTALKDIENDIKSAKRLKEQQNQ